MYVCHLLCNWLELQIRKTKVTQSEGSCFSESGNCHKFWKSSRAYAVQSLTLQGVGSSAPTKCLLGKPRSSDEGRKTRPTITQKVPAFPPLQSPQRSEAKGPGDWPFHWDLSSSVEMSQYWRWLTRTERAGQQDRAPETETPHEQCRVDLMSSVMSFRPAWARMRPCIK